MRSAPEAALISSCPIGSDNNSSLFEDTPVNASFPPLPRARKLCVRGSKCAGSAPPLLHRRRRRNDACRGSRGAEAAADDLHDFADFRHRRVRDVDQVATTNLEFLLDEEAIWIA